MKLNFYGLKFVEKELNGVNYVGIFYLLVNVVRSWLCWYRVFWLNLIVVMLRFNKRLNVLEFKLKVLERKV